MNRSNLDSADILREIAELHETLMLRGRTLGPLQYRAANSAYRRALLRAEAQGLSVTKIAQATKGSKGWIGALTNTEGDVAEALEDAHDDRAYGAHVDAENRILEELLDDYALGEVHRDELRTQLITWPYRETGVPEEELDPWADGLAYTQDSFTNVNVAHRMGHIDDELYREAYENYYQRPLHE